MNFIEPGSRSKLPARAAGGTGHANYYAFFDQPTPENLAANRIGILSEVQREALQSVIENVKTTTAILIFMLVCAGLGMGFLFWKIDSADGVVSWQAQFITAGVLLGLLGVFAAWFGADWFVFFAGDDLENREVESATGKVEWNGRRYTMRADTRLLRSLRSWVALPPPGDYRFYYLPRLGLVVLAEEMLTGKAEEPAAALFRALADANNFSLEDLHQNRSGSLSKHQENQLIRTIAVYMLIFLAAAVLFGSVTSQIMSAMSPAGYRLLILVSVILIIRFGWSGLQIIVDLWNGKVKSVDGPISLEVRRSRYSVSYYYVIGKYRFQVSQAAYNALVDGRRYRVYYVPHSKRLVALELL